MLNTRIPSAAGRHCCTPLKNRHMCSSRIQNLPVRLQQPLGARQFQLSPRPSANRIVSKGYLTHNPPPAFPGTESPAGLAFTYTTLRGSLLHGRSCASLTRPPTLPRHFISLPQLHTPTGSLRLFSSTPNAMTATKIDGTAIAKNIRERIHTEIEKTQKANPRYKPSLKIIQGIKSTHKVL